MKLLNTYDDRDDAEAAEQKLIGQKRLASERDGTEIIYHLFGIPSCGNFHRLAMYNLAELEALLKQRKNWQSAESARHQEILSTLNIFAKNHGINIPAHWF